ncbi:MAG: pilus assembly protein [Actinobacteria bacterium]|nr:pilus assembly protein [Actinomycetota bacterium]
MRRGRDIRSEGGQAAVEFALVLPLMIVLLLAIVEFGIAFSHYVTLTDAARVGARKAITVRIGGTTPSEAAQAVRDAAGGLDQSQLQVSVDDSQWAVSGSQITVTASYPYRIDIPLLGLSVVSGTLTARAEEPLE